MTQPTPAPRPAGAVVNGLLELAGLVLLVAFAYACWPKAALGVAAVILIVVANARARRAQPRPAGPHWTERAGRVLAALRGSG